MNEENKDLIKRNQNMHFIGNVKLLEEKLLSLCKESNVPVKIVDVLKEDNGNNTDLCDLFDELEKEGALLYLKNYTKTRPNVRYKFSCIYKDKCATKNGFVIKENLQYYGTVIISSKDDFFELDNSEASCFCHVEL